MNRYIATIVAVVILLAGLFAWSQYGAGPLQPDIREIGGTNATSTADILNIVLPEVETTGWNMYANRNYHFEFKYPKDWEVATSTANYIALISEKHWQELKTSYQNGTLEQAPIKEKYAEVRITVDKTAAEVVNRHLTIGGSRIGNALIGFDGAVKQILSAQPEQLIASDEGKSQRLCGSRLTSSGAFNKLLRSIDCADYFDSFTYTLPHEDVFVTFQFSNHTSDSIIGNSILASFKPESLK